MINEFDHCKYIYILRCPFDSEIIYVGCSNNPYQRFYTHCNRNNSNAPISEYIRDLKKIGFKPSLEIIETVSTPRAKYGRDKCNLEASIREKHFINYYNSKPNSRLLNVRSIIKL